MIRTILVDDEPIILEELKLMFKGSQNMDIVGTYSNPLEALQELAFTKPDCAVLDIEMVDLSGIELAEMLAQKNSELKVLFITAYNHYATQAFEVNAIDYILKPVRPERLAKALEKIHNKTKSEKQSIILPLKIRSFGSFEVFLGDKPIKWPRAKPRELFAYLLQNEGKGIEKYKLCDDLWRTQRPEQALANLQTAIWAIRKTLSEVGCTQVKIKYSHDHYQMDISAAAEWDLQQFDTAYNAFMASGLSKLGRIAENFYTGEYLQAEDWLWADLTRESYACKFKKLNRHLNKAR